MAVLDDLDGLLGHLHVIISPYNLTRQPESPEPPLPWDLVPPLFPAVGSRST